MKKFSIVWKLREAGRVTFRRDLNAASMEEAIALFRREERHAFIVRSYEWTPIDPALLAGLMGHLEQKAVADGWRSLGD
jgi:hypothetical protein